MNMYIPPKLAQANTAGSPPHLIFLMIFIFGGAANQMYFNRITHESDLFVQKKLTFENEVFFNLFL